MRLLSSSAYISASCRMRSTSLVLKPPVFWMRTLCSRLVPLSWAETLRIPLTSISKATSIWGTPRGDGGIPASTNLPRLLLSLAITRSPWRTWISTEVCPSVAVENTWDLLVGIVVLRSMILVNTSPKVSIPSDSGVTSKSKIFSTPPPSTPPWTAAPSATASSGFTDRSAVFPPKNFCSAFWTKGIRVEPPTKIIRSMSAGLSSQSFKAWIMGWMVFTTKGLTNSSNLARVSSISRCFGPVWSAVIKGKFITVIPMLESSILAFSAASRRRWRAILSVERSIFSCSRKCEIIHSRIQLSKSSPPRWLFPAVARTSNTPSPSCRMDTSNVPPPRSNTKIRCSWSSLSNP